MKGQNTQVRQFLCLPQRIVRWRVSRITGTIVFVACCLTAGAHADAALLTGAYVGGTYGNWHENPLDPTRPALYSDTSHSESSSNTGNSSEVSFLEIVEFQGFDANNNPETMRVEKRQTAGAFDQNAVFKTSSLLSITNPLFQQQNSPYIKDTDFEIDPSGIPESVALQNIMAISDRVTFHALPGVQYVQVLFGIEGVTQFGPTSALFNIGFSNHVRLGQNIDAVPIIDENFHMSPQAASGANQGFYSRFDYSNDPFLDVIISNPFGVDYFGGDTYQFDMGFVLDLRTRLEWGGFWGDDLYDRFVDGTYVSGQEFRIGMDLSNTITIKDIVAFDASGEELLILDAVGSTGIIYVSAQNPDNPVPEPSVVWLLTAGLLALLHANSIKKRRRQLVDRISQVLVPARIRSM
jgi:hypothetical protein